MIDGKSEHLRTLENVGKILLNHQFPIDPQRPRFSRVSGDTTAVCVSGVAISVRRALRTSGLRIGRPPASRCKTVEAQMANT